MNRADLNELKKYENLATSTSNTYLGYAAFAFTDTFNVPTTGSDVILDVASFYGDDTFPEVEFFDLDMNIGVLTLHFSETVRLITLNLTQVTLSNRRRGFPTTYTLTGGNFSQQPSPSVEVVLSPEDLNALKFHRDLANSNRTFLHFTEDLVVDMSNNNVTEVLLEAALRVRFYEVDSFNPTLDSFGLDMDEGLLSLTFSETVLAESLNTLEITITSGSLDNENTSFLVLTGGDVSSNDSTIIVVELSSDDFNDLKRQPDLAISENTTFIGITMFAVVDMNFNPVEEINASVPLQVSNFTNDTSPPQLVAFTLDMNDGILILTFDETVNVSTLDPTAITLQNDSSLSTYYTLTEAEFANATNDPVVTLTLTNEDVNGIKALLSLAKQESNTYISITSSLVQDMEGISVEEIFNSSALSVTAGGGAYVADNTAPTLIAFDLDADAGLLTLEFDETVDAATVQLPLLVIQSHEANTSGFVYYELRGSSAGTFGVSTVVQLQLSSRNILGFKTTPVATTNDTTYLLVRQNAIFDVALLPNGAAEVVRGVRNYTYDETGPNIISFDVDLTRGIVVVNFNEPVLATSLNTTGLTAISGPNSNTTYTLSGNATASEDDFSVVIELTVLELNKIKQLEDLWTHVNNTYIAVDSHFITDLSHNEVINISRENPLRVDNFFNDTDFPILNSFDLDMNRGILFLHFSETVNISTFTYSGITLQQVRNTYLMPEAHRYRLSGGSFISEGDVASVVTELSRADLNALKLLEIADSASTAHLVIDGGSVLDQSGNPNVGIINGLGSLTVRKYKNDVSGPILESFNLNLSNDTLTLFFDETVDVTSTFNVTSVTLHGFNDTTQYTLTEGSITESTNGPVIVIELSEFDRNNIKRDTDLATGENDTFISITSGVVRDMTNNPAQVVSCCNMSVDVFTNDSVSPYLQSFDLNLTTEVLTLYFSETVNVASFNETQVTFIDIVSGEFYSLTNASIEHEDDPIVYVNLTRQDLNFIKELTSLATSGSNTMISITAYAIEDMNSNLVVDIPFSEAIPVSGFVRDSVNPVLEDFELDMDSSTLTLSFSETVNTSSLLPVYITLQDGLTTQYNYTLTGGSTNTSNSSVVVVDITTYDMNLIKFDFSLATDLEDTYITITSSLVVDMFNNPVVSIVDGEAKLASNYTPDTTSPELESFDLDMDTGIMTFTFDETINSELFHVDSLTLQSEVDTTDPLALYTLKGGDWTMVNSTTLTLNLTIDDQDEIKYRFVLAIDANTTFITFDKDLVRDMNSNTVVPRTNGDALNVSDYTTDTTRPVLVEWYIDLNVGAITLSYDETVNQAAINVTQITLQESTTSNLTAHTFNNQTVSISDNGTSITIELSVDDLNEVKRKQLCTFDLQEEDCYITFTNASIEDMNKNAVVEREDGDAERVLVYTNDSSRPMLVDSDTDGFVEIDLSNGTLTLRFNETVNITSFNANSITLKPFYIVDTSLGVTLTGPDDTITDMDSTTLVFAITIFDLNRIKQRTDICTETLPPDIRTPDCYLEITSDLIRDMSRNPVVELEGAFAIRAFVATLLSDTVPPILVNFSVDMDTNNVTLTFDETVDRETFNPTAITFYNRPNATESHTLTGGTLLSTENWIYLSFELSFDDVVSLKALEMLATDENDTYISVTSDLIQDMNSNFVTPLPIMDEAPVGNATNETSDDILRVQAWHYEPDITPPELQYFTLNMEDGELLLTFSEPVRIGSLQYPSVTLQNMANGSVTGVQSVTLTGGSAMYLHQNKSNLVLYFTSHDKRQVKLMGNLAWDPRLDDTYLSMPEGTILDTSGNKLVEIPLNEGMFRTRLILDSLPPAVDVFDIDLNVGTLTLYYNDFVDQDSLDPRELTLHNSNIGREPTVNYTLTAPPALDNTNTDTSDGYFTVLKFSYDDLNELKRNEQLATSYTNTYITHTEDFIHDERGLPVDSIPRPLFGVVDALIVRNFTSDINPPSLIGYVLDIDEGVLHLTFNETVKSNTLNLDLITFQNIQSVDLLENVTYTFNETGFVMITGVPLDNITNLLNASGFNTTNMNVTLGHLNITGEFENMTIFELVDIFNTSEVTYYYPDSVLYYTLTGGSHNEDFDDPIIRVTLSKFDWDELKRIYGLAISNETTFITFPLDLIQDMNSNWIVERPTNDTLKAHLVPDTTPPHLVSWDLDMNMGIIVLHFPETINASSFDVTQIRIQSAQSSVIGHNLRDGSHTLDDTIYVVVWITKEDLDEIKRIEQIATSDNDSYISFTQYLVEDMNFNAVVERSTTNALGVTNFTQDTTPPVLISYDLDMDSDTLLLTFSETVDADTIVYDYFTLLSGPGSIDEFGILTLGGDNSTDTDSTMINLTFSKTNSDEVRRLYNLATANYSTYLSIMEGAILDMIGNNVTNISQIDPEQVRIFTPDTTEPFLESFDLDFDSDQLYLTFSETVDATTFDVLQITLFSANTGNDANETVYNLTLTGGDFTIDNSTLVVVNITLEDSNELKRKPGLVSSNETTFIAFTSDLVDDMNSNNVTVIYPNNSQPVLIYTEDTTPPELLDISFNVTSEQLILFFSETVNTTSLDVTTISFVREADEEVPEDLSFSFSEPGTFTGTPFNDIVTVQIGLEDLNELKRIRGLADDGSSRTYLTITNSTVVDMNGNAVVEATGNDSLPLLDFSPDANRPQLVSYSLDIDSGVLVLNFTETIDIYSLNISEITLQPYENASESDALSYTLTMGHPPLFSSTMSNDTHAVSIDIGSVDLNAIKAIVELAREPNATFLSFSHTFVSDIAGNSIVPVTNRKARPIQPDAFSEDVQGPIILSFSLDLTSGVLVLTFDETVNISSVRFPLIALLSEAPVDPVSGSGSTSGSGSDSGSASGSGSGSGFNSTEILDDFSKYTLTGADDVTIEGAEVTITLTKTDLDHIKLIRNLASSTNDTYLQAENSAFLDNALEPNPSNGALLKIEEDNYTPDRLSPILNNFIVNLNTSVLILNFDEPVDTETFDPTGLILQGSERLTDMRGMYQLTGGRTPSVPGLSVIVQITDDDLNEIKRNEMIYTDIYSAYLVIDSKFIRDMAGNPVTPVIDGEARRAEKFTDDETMPQLVSFTLNMDEGYLILTFSETINISSLNLDQFTIQKSSDVNTSLATSSYTLQSSTLYEPEDSTVVFVNISNEDLNQIKSRRIANRPNTTWVVFPSTFVFDQNSQEVGSRDNGLDALQVLSDDYTADTTEPVLESYTLDLTQGEILLTFSETVDIGGSFDVREITIQNSARIVQDVDGLYYYTLTNSSYSTTSPDGPIVTVILSLSDLDALKARETLATNTNNTFVSFSSLLLADTVANQVTRISNRQGLKASEVAPDTLPPELDDFVLDLSTETLILYFSETVNVGSVDLTEGVFLSGPLNSTDAVESVRLTGGLILSMHTPVVEVLLNNPDLNEIKQLYNLATNVNNTYFSLTSLFVTDTSDLNVVPINMSYPKQAFDVVLDTVRPTLVAFDLSLDGLTGTLTLTFDETVNADTLDVTAITVQDDSTIQREYYTLESSTTQSMNGTVIVIDLTEADTNGLKEQSDLASYPYNTFLSLTSSAITDMTGNSVVEIGNKSARGVARYTEDKTRPTLRSFTFNLTSGVVMFSFSETVRASSFDSTAITFQSSSTLDESEDSYTLTDSVEWTMVDDTEITLTLSFNDLNNLKQRVGVATRPENTFINFTSLLVVDMNANPIIGTDESEERKGTQVQTGSFAFDTAPPALLEYVVDLEVGVLMLTFSEAVNITTLDPTLFTIRDCCFYCDTAVYVLSSGSGSGSGSASGSGGVTSGMGFGSANLSEIESGSGSGSGSSMGSVFNSSAVETETCNETLYDHTLTGGRCITGDQTVFLCPLTFEDLNEIKRQQLCVFDNSGMDCCLSISGSPILDQASNPLDNIFDGCGFDTTSYVPDTNPPSLVAFTQFNLEDGTVTLTFNETILASSVNLTRVTLQSFYRNPQMSHTLTGGEVTSPDSINVQFTLSEADLLAIQRHRGLCSDINNCWISLAEGFATDMAENVALVVPANLAVDAAEFVDDVSSPSLVSFQLDLNNNTLTLTFDEIVSASSLDASAISIYGEPSVNASFVQFTGGTTSSTDGRIIVVDLLYGDTNMIRSTEEIGTSEQNTFISITSSLITDAVRRRPNPVIAITADEAIPITAGGLTTDKTPPNLDSFSLDLDFDLISLTFDEPVRVSSLNYQGITLISSQSLVPSDKRALVGGTNTENTNFNGTMVLTGQLEGPDIRYLKLSQLLATSIEDTWLSIAHGSILDMAGNKLVAIPFVEALPVSEFYFDTTPAELIDVALDMNLGLLHLTFNDIINASTFYPEAVTIQNTRVLSQDSVTLTSGSFTDSENGYFMSINISTADLNRVKFNDNLGTSHQNVHVSLRAEAFKDNYGVYIIATTSHAGVPASDFISDTTSPILLDFELDLNNGAVLLTFDETVRALTIIEEEIILQNVKNFSANDSLVTLTGGSSSEIDSTLITVYTITEDLNEIKRLIDLGTDMNNTFIAFSGDLIMDMNMNLASNISVEDALMSLMVYPDKTSPVLLNFTIDLTLEEIVLTFDETVNGSSLAVSEFTVQGAMYQGEDFRQLHDSTHSSDFSTVVTIHLGLDDLNEIKRLTSVATSTNNTFIAATEFAIQDMSDNYLSPIPPFDAIPALNFSGDEIQPELIGFSFNLTSEILTLSFSETVSATTLTASSITIYSMELNDSTAQSHSLTGGILEPFNYHEIELELTTADLNIIKQLTDLAVLTNNTYLTILGGAIEDMNGNLLVPVDRTTSLVANELIPDSVPPELLLFNLDVDVGILTLMFSETVNVSTLDIEEITLQDAPFADNVTHQHTLSSASSTSSPNSAIVMVDIADADLNEIKRLHFLARNDNSSTYLSTTSLLVADMNDNSLVAIGSNNALPVSIYIKDTNRPELEEFDLNLNSSELTLRFNETVNTQSLDVESITIQHAENSSGPSFTLSLTNSSFTDSLNDTYLVVDISTLDLNDLKRLTSIATSHNNTFLSITSETIDDMEQNAVIQIPGSNALQVTNFTQDYIRPILLQFSLDIDSGILILTFSETVNVSSLNISLLMLQSERTVADDGHTLTEGQYPEYSFTNSTDDPVVTVYIGTSDLNAIKAIYQLATSSNNTFISFPNDTVLDMINLLVEPILEYSALPVAAGGYQEDVTGPLLLSYTLNLTSEELILTFDETVNVGSFNITHIRLQSGENPVISSDHALRDYRTISSDNSTTVTILLSLDDLDDIKLDTDLAVSSETTWLYIDSPAVLDMALDPNSAQNLTLAIEESSYVEDTVDPVLVSFSVDMDRGLLYLSFDEPVNISSIEYTSITLISGRSELVVEVNVSTNSTLYNETNINGTLSNATMEIEFNLEEVIIEVPVTNFTLTNGSTNSANGRLVVINITVDDLNEIKRNEYLFTSNLTSYLTIDSTAIEDMNGNPVVPIPPSTALPVTDYLDDTTPPLFLGFDLDMDSGLITLSFPETVDVSTVLFTGLILQQGPNVSLEMSQYMLASGNLTMMEDGVTALVQITHDDLNEIKRRNIAVTRETAWLTINESAILDMADQAVVMMTHMVSNYTPDTTDPRLQSFDLDLDAEVLTLSFTETVDVTRFNITSITLQDTPGGNFSLNHYSLTDSSFLVTSTYHTLEIVLGLDDLNNIKVLTDLATDHNNTFISIGSDLVADVFGNSVEEISTTMALDVSTYTADNTTVVLEEFDLDLDLRVLTLYFSESVNASSVDVTGITLTGGQDPGDQSFQLQESYVNSTDGPTILVFLPRYDFNTIKTLIYLATNENDTFIEVTETAVFDMAGNTVQQIQRPNAKPVLNYTADVSPPMLESFDLDMNGVNITLYFSETVNVSSINFLALTLVESRQPYAINYTLMDGNILSPNGPTVTILFSKEDEDNLKRITEVATSEDNTFLLITSELVTDMDDNPVVNRTSPTPLPVRNFTADIIPPYLVNFTLDLDSNILTLTFSETVNASSLSIDFIGLQAAAELDNTTQYYVFTDSLTIDPTFDHPILEVNLSRFDGNEIRKLRELATELDSTYLTLEEGAVLDMVGGPSLPQFNYSAMVAANYTSDATSPVLEAFTFNLTTEVLTLSFSETVDIKSFDSSEVTIHSGRENTSESFTLTGGIVIVSYDTPDVALTLTRADLNIIKLNTLLATDLVNTYLTLTAATVEDVSNNPVVPVSTPELTDDYFPDIVLPELEEFDLDMNLGLLILAFSESVNASSLDVTEISLQPSTNVSSPPFTFTTSSFTGSDNGPVLTVNISLPDLNQLKRLTELATSNYTTYISVTHRAVRDMNNNFISVVSPTTAIPVSDFTRDDTKPRLLSFTLDLDEENLTLSFSETVNSSSVDVTAITIVREQSGGGTSSRVTLTDAYVSAENDPVLTVVFSQEDLNLLKSLTDLGTDVNNTFVSVESYFLMDMFDNEIESVTEAEAIPADVVYPDKTQPQLRNFTLNVNTGEIAFTFSESVNASSLQVTELTLQSRQNETGSNYTLQYQPNIPLITRQSGTIIVLTLNVDDLNQVKALVDLATSVVDTYISFTSQLLFDQSDNEIVPVTVNKARQAEFYTPDISCPYLQDFSLDLNTGLLNLTFKEPVNTSTFDPTQVKLEGDPSISPLHMYWLTGGDYQDRLYTQHISLQLTQYDLNLIKADTDLATEVVNTYAILTQFSVVDANTIPYCAGTNPRVASEVVPDTTPPQLVDYTLNVESSELVLTFSEVVVLPLDLTAITFLAEPDLSYMVSTGTTSGSGSASSGFSTSGSGSGSGLGSGSYNTTTAEEEPEIISYSLTDGISNIDYSTTPHIVTVSITPYDLNHIKYRPEIAVSAATTLLALSPSLTTDHSDNAVTEVLRSIPQELNSSKYFPDITQPELISYSLNMNTLILSLSFTEVVNLTSFDVSLLTLQEIIFLMAGEHYTLQSSSVSINPLNLPEVLVDLSASNSEDANAIKKLTSLAASPDVTYLSFPSSLLTDTFGLPVVPIAETLALPIDPSDYTVDSSPPILRYFSLNLTTDELMLTFDETVARFSTDPLQITFHSDLFGSNPVQLSGGVVQNMEDSTIITILLSDFDLNNIKRDLDLATRRNNTCIAVESAVIHDLSTLSNTNDPTSLCASEYGEDLVSPQLVDFTVDLIDEGLLTLIFDEPIDINTINLTLLTLQSAQSFGPTVETLTLSGGSATTTNQLQVVVNMTRYDLNTVKSMLSLLRGEASSFISIPPEFITDVNGNQVAEINRTFALMASDFINDGTEPRLLAFDMDMNTGVLTLYFSETVDVSTFDFTGITLQLDSTVTDTPHYFTLTPSTTSLVGDSPTVPLLISNDDLNVLKTRGIGRTEGTIWLTLRNYTVMDVLRSLPVHPIVNGSARPVRLYTNDTTPPLLEMFDIDLTAETLTLYFNESVDTHLLDVTQITLTPGPDYNESFVFTLTENSFSTSENVPIIVVHLGTRDLNVIKQNVELATSRNNTYIYFTEFTIADTFGNLVVERNATNALRVSQYQEDNTPPILVGFDLDMNTGMLTLSFDETVNSSSLNTAGVIFYGDDSGMFGDMYTLSGLYDSVTTPADIIEIVLTNDDLNEIKILEGLATDGRNDTFILIEPSAITDMRGNEVTTSDIIAITTYMADETIPDLYAFEIDMDSGQLTLNFTESVNGSSLRFDYLALLRYETFVPTPIDPDDQFQLTDGAVITSNGPSLTLQLTEDDLNEIKRQDMCTKEGQEESCYLVYRSDAIADMNRNLIFGCRQTFEST